MKWICPTVTAKNQVEYKEQLDRIKDFTHRVHVDISDGSLTENILLNLDDIWMPHIRYVDIHMMVRNPERYFKKIVELKPHMVIVHAEADCDLTVLAAHFHAADIKVGLALLPDTQIFQVRNMLPSFDAMLIFGGHLGYQGGSADLSQLHKIADEKSREAREHQPHLEVMWDGGVNADNARTLIRAGVDVLNVGSYIHKDEKPAIAYNILQSKLYS